MELKIGKVITRRRIYDTIICLALLSVVTALVLYPEEAVQAGGGGVSPCLNTIIPSLFPFFVISSLVVELGIAARLGRLIEPLMTKVFNVNGACSAAFVLGFIGGYPVGAKTAISLYEKGQCSKSEAERLLSFCNNSGPAFILGVVGAGVFSNSFAGLLLYLAHSVASVIIGILFRNWGRDDSAKHEFKRSRIKRVSFSTAFTVSVRNSFQSTLSICGFVIFFTVFIRLLFLSGVIPFLASAIGGIFHPLGMDEAFAEKLLTGFIEISSGVWTLQDAAPHINSNIAMAAFMLGWAGLSVHCQALSFLCDSGLSAKTYIMGKFLHGIISAGLVYMVYRLFLLDAPVSSYLAEQVTGMANFGFSRSLVLSAGCSLLLLVCLLLISYAIPAKNSGNEVKKGL